MNKKIIILFAAVFGAIGSYVPTLLGDDDLLSGWGDYRRAYWWTCGYMARSESSAKVR